MAAGRLRLLTVFLVLLIAPLALLSTQDCAGQNNTYLNLLQALGRDDLDYAQRAVDSLLRSGSGREGDRLVKYEGTHKYAEYYPHLALGVIQLRRSRREGSSQEVLLRSAIAEFGRSLVEKPSFPALLLLARAYAEGGAAYRTDLNGLLNGGEFTFDDSPWKDYRDPLAPAQERKGSIGRIAFTYSYAGPGNPVKVKLREKLPPSLDESLIRSLGAGDIGVLGKEGAEIGGIRYPGLPTKESFLAAARAQAAWKKLYDQVAVLPLFLVNGQPADPKKPLSGTLSIEARVENAVLEQWSLRRGDADNAEALRGASGPGPTVRAEWDTLGDAVEDTLHRLWLHYSYRSPSGALGSNRAPLVLLVKNPEPEVRLDAVVSRDETQREVLLTIASSRPLVAPMVDLRTDLRLEEPDLPQIGGFTQSVGEPPLRFLYRRYQPLPRSLSGSIEVTGRFQPNIGKELFRTGSFAVPAPLKVGVVLSRNRTGPTTGGGEPVEVSVEANDPITPAETRVEVDFPDGSVVTLPAPGAPPARQVSPVKIAYQLGIPDGLPAGEARVRARVGAVRCAPRALRIITQVAALDAIAVEGSQSLLVGRSNRVALQFTAPLQEPPRVTVRGPGDQGLPPITCDTDVEPGRFTFSLLPQAAGEYRIEIAPVRDLLGSPARLPAEGRLLSARAGRSVVFRPERSPLPAGSTRVFVAGTGLSEPPRITLVRRAGGTPQAMALQPAEGGGSFVTVPVAAGEEGQVELRASGGGLESEERQSLRVDGQPPRFRIDGLPAVVTAAGRYACTITAFEPLRPGTKPRLFAQQSAGSAQEGEVRPDPERPDQWLGNVLIQPIAGDARVFVRGFDLAGNGNDEESFQSLEVRIRQRVPVVIEPERRIWGPGEQVIRVRSAAGPLADLPLLRLYLPGKEDTPAAIRLERDSGGFIGRYTLFEGSGAGTATLQAEGAATGVTSVAVRSQPSQLRLALPSRVSPGPGAPVQLLSTDALAAATLHAAITTPQGKTRVPVPLRPAVGRQRWLGTLEIKPEYQKIELEAEGTDLSGIQAPGTAAALPIEPAGWQLRAAPAVIGIGGTLQIEAQAPAGTAGALVEARVRIPGARPIELASLSLSRADGNATPYRGQFGVDAATPGGEAAVVLLVDHREVASFPVLFDTSRPSFRVSATTSGQAVRVEAELEGDETLPEGAVPSGTIARLNRPLTFRAGSRPGQFLADVMLPPGTASGAYRVRVEAADTAGNPGEGTTLVRVGDGGPLRVDWFDPPPTGGTVDRLDVVHFRVTGLVREQVSLVVTQQGGSGAQLEVPVSLLDQGLIQARSLAPGLPEDTMTVRIDPARPLPFGRYALEVRVRRDPGDPSPMQVLNQRVEVDFSAGKTPGQDRFAIIVAVQNYAQFGRLTSLQNPYRDAAKLRAALLARGYPARNIRILTDSAPPPELRMADAQVRAADATSLLASIQAAADEARQQKARYLVFAFFGHGWQKGGMNWLLPAAVQTPNLERTAITPQDVIKVVNGASAGTPIRHLLLLMDACRNGVGARVAPTPLDPLQGDTLTAYYACSGGEESLELLRPQKEPLNFTGGLFTEMFVRALSEGKHTTWDTFENDLYSKVREAALQLGEGRLQRPDRQAVPAIGAKATLAGFFSPADGSAQARRGSGPAGRGPRLGRAVALGRQSPFVAYRAR